MFFEHPASRADDDGPSVREQFTGTAPLFPLGNLTLLPNVVQPFHMFEPRYRRLAEDAVEGDGFISLGILQPNRPADYESKTAQVFPAACVGRIMQYEPLPGGRWNLIVQGHWRCLLEGEREDSRPYRTAELAILDEQPAESDPEFDADAHREELVDLFRAAEPKLASYPAISDVLEQELPIGMLADFVAHAIDMSPTSGAALLAEPAAARRCCFLTSLLRSQLRELHGSDRPFPPEFSAN